MDIGVSSIIWADKDSLSQMNLFAMHLPYVKAPETTVPIAQQTSLVTGPYQIAGAALLWMIL